MEVERSALGCGEGYAISERDVAEQPRQETARTDAMEEAVSESTKHDLRN
jgi:hypothetical protein